MSRKQRLSVSVDDELVEAAERAVASGQVATVSAWVNDALRLKVVHERRQRALAEFIAGYEAEYGEITPEEMARASRRARSRALPARVLSPREPASDSLESGG